MKGKGEVNGHLPTRGGLYKGKKRDKPKAKKQGFGNSAGAEPVGLQKRHLGQWKKQEKKRRRTPEKIVGGGGGGGGKKYPGL